MTVEEIERSGDLRDGFELDFARIDGALDEVLEERRMGYVGEKEILGSLKAFKRRKVWIPDILQSKIPV